MITSRMYVFIILTLLLALCAPATASPAVLQQHLQTPTLVGEGRLKVMFWNVFDARLYSANGSYSANEPFALSLSYLRTAKSDVIVDRSLSEISRQGTYSAQQLERWRTDLSQIMPDVEKGTVLTGLRNAQGHALFYQDGQLIGRIDDTDFSRAFFNIWLGPDSSQPELQRRLTGQLTAS